jgi:8-oxo-dGTP diphosphatase
MKTVTAALIFDGPKVLLTRRAPSGKLAGFWEFPGGKLEEGETLQECLARELEEELGIRAKVFEIIAQNDHHYEGGSIRLIALEARISDGDIRLTVHDAIEWVHAEKLLEFKLAPADIPIAKMAIQHIRNREP